MINRIILSSNFSPWSPYQGGGQRSTHQLAEALADLKHDVHVIYTKARFENIKTPNNLSYQVHWAEYPAIKSNRKNWFRGNSRYSVAEIVRALLKPKTVYHSNGEESSHIHQLRSNGSTFPFILTPRYPHVPEKVGKIDPSRKNLILKPALSKYLLLGKSLRECDIFCPTSNFAASLYCEVFNIGFKPFDVVPNGVTDEFINYNVTYNLKDHNRLIYFGRLSKEKGVEILLKAASLISESIDELVIIGRGELEEKIDDANKYGSLRGKITRMDWMVIPELIRELSYSKVAVLPSFAESFGNTIVESMACGIPVISTNAGSIPEIIDHNINGILVKPGDYRQLADQIKLVLNSPEKSNLMAKNARTEVVKKYSWMSTAKKFEHIYCKLL